MKKLILAASAIALIPAAAHAQLLGGGGGLGGGLGGTLGGTIERTTTTVRGTVDSTVSGRGSTRGSQSVDARKGTVQAERSTEGSITGSTASLADLVVPPMGGMTQASGSGSASGQGSANAQLIGTDAVTGTLAPVAGTAKSFAANTAGTAVGTARGAAQNAPMPGMPAIPALGGISGEGSGSGSGGGEGSASLMPSALAVAGSAAAAGEGMTSVAPGMPVMTPDGASLGKVREVIANGRGEIQQVVVKQGKVTRALPAAMFSASGNALVAGEAHLIEDEEFEFGADVDRVADAAVLYVLLGLGGHVARVAAVGLARHRVLDVADHRERRRFDGRVDDRRRRVGDEEHVGLFDLLEAANAGAVETVAFAPGRLRVVVPVVELVDGARQVLPKSEEVDEFHIDEADIVLRAERFNFLRGHLVPSCVAASGSIVNEFTFVAM